MPNLFGKANQLSESSSRNDIDLALAYYRQIITAINKLPSKEILEYEEKEAEKKLAKLISKHRMQELETFLEQGKIGKFIANSGLDDLEKQYSEGALQTTYMLLMKDFGAGADVNNDGFLNDAQEAAQIPCITLIEIEQLWQLFDRKCRWEDAFSDPDCINEPNPLTLTASIFDWSKGVTIAMERVNFCRQEVKKYENT